MDSPPGPSDSPAKKRRKGATRLSCAECRRYVYLTSAEWDIRLTEDSVLPGLNYAVIEQFHAALA